MGYVRDPKVGKLWARARLNGRSRALLFRQVSIFSTQNTHIRALLIYKFPRKYYRFEICLFFLLRPFWLRKTSAPGKNPKQAFISSVFLYGRNVH